VPAIAVATQRDKPPDKLAYWLGDKLVGQRPDALFLQYLSIVPDVTALLFLELAKARVVVMRKWHREVAGLAVQDHQLVNVPLWIVMCAPAL